MACSLSVTGTEAGAAAKAGAIVAKPVGAWLWRRWRPDTSRTALAGSADNLADAVLRRETVRRDELRGGPSTVMDLEFRATARVRSGEGDIGALSDIGRYYRRRTAPRRLVLLGAAGAGKTVSAIHLVLDLLAERVRLPDAERVEAPVPIRVNAAGCDGGESFSSWLADRMSTDYGIHRRVARTLIDAGRILPVLDGLDEMDAPDEDIEHAGPALDRLNETPWRNRPVVVVCRTDVFDRIRERRGDAGVHGATTLTLQPFTAVDIVRYLDEFRDQLGVSADAWAPVTDQVAATPTGPLAGALTTPWLLGLAATALHRSGRDTAEGLAACGNSAQVRDELFAAMIPAAVAGTDRSGRARTYTEDNVTAWLRTLAGYLHEQRGSGRAGAEIALDQLWELVGTRCRILHALGAALVSGLGTGLVGALAFGIVGGVVLGVISAVVLLPLLLDWKTGVPQRFARRVPGRTRWRRGVADGLITGALAAAVAALLGILAKSFGLVAAGIDGGLASALVAAAINGLVWALVFGIIGTLRTSDDEQLVLGQHEQRLIRDDLSAALVFALLSAFAFGSVFGFIGGLDGGPDIGLTYGVVYGVAVGPMVGFISGRAAGRYLTAVLIFRATKAFPPRPAHFLDWARNTGLLRVTGIAYQFRHDTYLQWLADSERTRSSAPAA